MKNALITAGALLLILVAVVGAYQLGWWLEEDRVNREAEIDNDSYARQSALNDQVIDDYRTITDIDVQLSNASEEQAKPLRAQRQAILNEFCDNYAQLTGTTSLSDSILAYAERECP